jgi:hypothetical protein
MTVHSKVKASWKRSKKHGIYLTESDGEMVGVCRLDKGRYSISHPVRGDEVHGYNGKYLTWRPTLREAKERASWAGWPDLQGADKNYT